MENKNREDSTDTPEKNQGTGEATGSKPLTPLKKELESKDLAEGKGKDNSNRERNDKGFIIPDGVGGGVTDSGQHEGVDPESPALPNGILTPSQESDINNGKDRPNK